MEAMIRWVNSNIDHVNWTVIKEYTLKHKLGVTAALIAVYGLWFIKRPTNLPPGPYGYPLVGSLTTICGDFIQNLNKLSEKYGDVFTLWFGSDNYYVILNSYHAIREVYISRGGDFSDRLVGKALPGCELDETIFQIAYNDTYKTSRKIGANVFRNMINDKFDILMARELDRLNEYILQTDTDILVPTLNVFANIMLEILFRKNYPHNHKELVLFSDEVCTIFTLSDEASLINFVPNIFSPLLRNKIEQSKSSFNILIKHLEEYIEECKRNPPDDADIKCLSDAYLDDTSSKIAPEKIAATILFFFTDGIYTAVYTCQWIFAYLLNYPQYQEKILSEVKDLKGEESVCVADRQNMPVTESFIMEVLRIVTPFRTGFLIYPKKDTTFRGYNIPAYVGLMPNFEAVHNDPKVFPKPNTFKPERFIKNGKIGNIEGFMPFGLGRRMCAGEAVVRNTMFLYFSSLIQKYKILPTDDGPPSLEKDISGSVVQTKPFKVRMEERVY